MSKFFARFIGRKVTKILYTETAIALYEKQIAARAAMGTKYVCHPINAAERIRPMSGETIFFGFEPVEIGIPSGPPMLRLVK